MSVNRYLLCSKLEGSVCSVVFSIWNILCLSWRFRTITPAYLTFICLKGTCRDSCSFKVEFPAVWNRGSHRASVIIGGDVSNNYLVSTRDYIKIIVFENTNKSYWNVFFQFSDDNWNDCFVCDSLKEKLQPFERVAGRLLSNKPVHAATYYL